MNEKDVHKAIRGEATSRLKGFLYQFMVALDACFELGEGQSLYVETYGDLAIRNDGEDDVDRNEVSMEIKMYDEDDELGVIHHNFLNTLFNWLEEGFDFDQYKQLILFSTQRTKINDVLCGWNEKTKEEKYTAVFNEYNDYIQQKEKFIAKERIENPSKKHPTIEANLRQMKFILYSVKDKNEEVDANASKNRLSELLNKVRILERQDAYIDFYEKRLLSRSNFDHDKSVILINALLGFILNPALVESSWQISYDNFRRELNMWAEKLSGSKCPFPQIDVSDEMQIDEEALFVKKLREIEWDNVILSVREYAIASKFIEEEASSTVIQSSFDEFKSDLLSLYESSYGEACALLEGDVINKSRAFLYKIFKESMNIQFSIYQHTDNSFRKGVYHSMANEESNNIVWKLR